MAGQGHVRGARHLPITEAIGVGLADPVARRRLAFGVDHHDGMPRSSRRRCIPSGILGVAAVRRRIPGDGHDGVTHLERGPAAEVHHEEEGVEAPGDRLHAVEVGGQPRRRLRRALGDQPADVEAAHDVERRDGADRAPPGLPPA